MNYNATKWFEAGRKNDLSLTPISVFDAEITPSGAFRVLKTSDIREDAGPYKEGAVTYKTSLFHFESARGVSIFRDDLTPQNGQGITETSGEIRLRTDASVGNVKEVKTVQRGRYTPGSIAQAGIAVRIPILPSGDQSATWGYFDTGNGFGFGVNSTGTYVFLRKDGVETKTYQNNWNIDKMYGTGISNTNLYLGSGNVYEIDFTWYGYGTATYSILTVDNGKRRKHAVHRTTAAGAPNVVDPNQPITFRVENGNLTSGSYDVFMGGRQFSLIGGVFNQVLRPAQDFTSDYTISAAQNVWQPIIGLRKNPTHGANSRPNSTSVSYKGFEASADNSVDIMVTYGGTLTGTPDWGYPKFWSGSEIASQTRVTNGLLTGVVTGNAIGFAQLRTSNQVRIAAANKDEELILGNNMELILWAQKKTANATSLSAILEWDEEW